MPNSSGPRYSTFDQLQLSVLTKAASLVMARPPARTVFDQFRMTVHAVAELSPNLRRVTFHAREFADFEPAGPDECFALLMPPAGQTSVTMPSADRINVRQAVRKMPEDRRPELRWYTIRALRPREQEIDVDFVLHGDSGPGSRWAGSARAGFEVGFRAGSATYLPPAGAETELLAADETALPALSAILESRNGGGPSVTHAFVELPDESYRQPVDTSIPVTWLYRGTDAPGSRLLPAVRGTDLSTVEYAWLCGESAIATGLRRHLVKDRGIDRRRILFSGYWKLGQARF